MNVAVTHFFVRKPTDRQRVSAVQNKAHEKVVRDGNPQGDKNMIQDARDLIHGAALNADVCIVGAGAAGISIALGLIDSGMKVILLESGGMDFEEETQALNAGTVVDMKLHSPADRYRQRGFGGTTAIWGGRCVPLDDIDFEQRDYMDHSGWPIGPEHLAPYYAEANRLCEAGDFAYTVDKAFSESVRPMIRGFRSSRFSSDTLERFSCPTHFGLRYLHRLRAAENIHVVLHANVTELKLEVSGRYLESLTARTLSGTSFEVKAARVVLATGGLEVARLLLANRDVHKNGIGNDRDVVGRYYMCHVAGTIGDLTLNNASTTVWHGYHVADDGIYCRPRLALTEHTQNELRVGNFVARLHHPKISNPSHRTGILSLLYLARKLIPYEYAKRLDDGAPVGQHAWLRHLMNVINDPWETLKFSWHLLRDRFLSERKFPSLIVVPRNNSYSLDFHAEQYPNPESRVTLGEDKDAFGVPRLKIDWRYTRRDVESVQISLSLLAFEISRSRVGCFEFDPETVELEMIRYGAYGGHHIGTARMGNDPSSSVTDSNGRVHGVNNLFVAGSALFPTSSQANPTLTIVALALRNVAYLKQQNAQDLREMAALPACNREAA